VAPSVPRTGGVLVMSTKGALRVTMAGPSGKEREMAAAWRARRIAVYANVQSAWPEKSSVESGDLESTCLCHSVTSPLPKEST